MQYVALEVEFNILVAGKLKCKTNRDRGRGRSKTLTSSSSASPLQMDKVTKLLKSLSYRMEKIELEGKQRL
jgi:hypothetical protein